ncbi:MAG: RNA polymerase sigma-70 factor [Bacteroidales bacterium]
MTSQENPDILLCREIRNGNKAAFEKVFRIYYASLCSYASTLSGSYEEAEEIVQDVFFRIWQDKDKLDIQISLKAYLFRAIRNGCLNHIKHEKIKINYARETVAIQNNTQPAWHHPMESRESQQRVMTAIEKLPSERQKIFRMIRLEERKYKEVAGILGISVKTVENQMGKAMRFLREELKDLLFFILLLILTYYKNILP